MRSKHPLLFLCLLAGLLVWLFGRALALDELFVFRDAAHYYYPLYKFIAGQWGEGRVPLWNPQENLGQPLLADATAAVLYPGKLVFALPWGFDANYKLYIVGHVLLAAAAAFVAARGFARSYSAATICGLSYAFSGSVLFQYCNVVYLVGAAWLPLALLAADRILTRRSWIWAAVLGAVLAMMILGGEPQMAYHAMLAAGLYAVVLWRFQRGDSAPAACGFVEKSKRLGTSRAALLLGAAASAFLLAAVQILPSAAWTPVSTRAAFDAPRNVYELAASFDPQRPPASPGRYGFLLGRTADGHHLDSYHFSVGPWHAAGCLWPNCFGRVFPINTRWISALPAEDRTWTPTLYMGLLPLLLALSQFRFAAHVGRHASAAVRRKLAGSRAARLRPLWLSWMVLLALLAALGWYSLGWLAIEIYHGIFGADARELPVGSPWGGVYWLFQTVLPGYVYFRYPAKWLVVAAMGMSLLAAFGWDRLEERGRFVPRSLLIVLAASVVLLAAAGVIAFATPLWNHLAAAAPKDDLFGPLDIGRARWELLGGLLHAAVVAGLLWRLLRRTGGGAGAGAALLILTALELAVAQRHLVPTAPTATVAGPSAVAQKMRRELARNGDRHGSAPPIRADRRYWMPVSWQDTASPGRQIAGAAFDRQTLFPKYHLLDGVELIESSDTVVSLEHQAFVRTARRHRLLPAIGTQFAIAPADEEGFTARPRRLRAAPRAWIVHRVEILPVLRSRHPAAIRERTREVLLPNGPRGLAVAAVVETGKKLPVSEEHPAPIADGLCEITRYEPDRVELRVRLAQDGLVVLSDTFAGGWTCEITDRQTGQRRPAPILRTNRVMRGVWLPPGEYGLEYRYRPRSFYLGAAVSSAAWAGLAAVGTIFGLRFARRIGQRRGTRQRRS